MLKIAVFAPIPSASVMTAIAVTSGCLNSMRMPYLKSWKSVFITDSSAHLENPVILSNDLLVTERHEWIDFRCSPRRHVTSQQRRKREHYRIDHKYHRISRTHAIQQRRQHACGSKRRQQTNDDPDHGQLESISQDELQHVARTRAQRHTHANLVRPLGHGESHDAVNADRREDQSKGRKQTENEHVEASW